jgi:hypothetical protein
MLNGTFWYKDNVLLLNKYTNPWSPSLSKVHLIKDTTGNICFIFRFAYTFSFNMFYLCVCTVLISGTPFILSMYRVPCVLPEYALLGMLCPVLLRQNKFCVNYHVVILLFCLFISYASCVSFMFICDKVSILLFLRFSYGILELFWWCDI